MAREGDRYARATGGACGLFEAVVVAPMRDGQDVRLRLEDGKLIEVTERELSKHWQLVQTSKGKMVPPA